MNKQKNNSGCVGCLASVISIIIILVFSFGCIAISIKFFPIFFTIIISVFFIFLIPLSIIGVIQGANGYSHSKNVKNNSNKKYMTSEEWERELAEIEKGICEVHKDIANIKEELDGNLRTNSEINFDNINGHQFEQFCADVLRKNKFKDVQVTQGSGDHGIDILAEKDGISYAIQCKCYSSNIGNAAVQQAHTGKSLYHKDIAVVMTNRYFTSQAKEEAEQLSVKLWDRDKLNEMIWN